jgi:hypothetical protein
MLFTWYTSWIDSSDATVLNCVDFSKVRNLIAYSSPISRAHARQALPGLSDSRKSRPLHLSGGMDHPE